MKDYHYLTDALALLRRRWKGRRVSDQAGKYECQWMNFGEKLFRPRGRNPGLVNHMKQTETASLHDYARKTLKRNLSICNQIRPHNIQKDERMQATLTDNLKPTSHLRPILA